MWLKLEGNRIYHPFMSYKLSKSWGFLAFKIIFLHTAQTAIKPKYIIQ